VMSTNIWNFKESPVIVSGFIKCFYGLSASIVALFYTTFFNNDAVSFLLFLCIFVLVDMIPVIMILRKDDTSNTTNPKSINLGMGILALILLTCALNAILDKTGVITHDNMVPWYIFFALVWIQIGSFQSMHLWKFSDEESSCSGSIQGSDISSTRDFTLSEALKDPKFYFLFVCNTIGMGAGLMFINNISEVYISTFGDVGGKALIVSILSIFNALGRAGAGAVFAKYRPLMSTPSFYCFTFLFLSISFALLSIDANLFLYPCVCLTGAAYGSTWVLSPVILKDFYGTNHFGSIYAVSQLSAALGALLFSTLLFGEIYDEHANGDNCYGEECYRLTFIITASASAIGFGIMYYLSRITKKLYFPRESEYSVFYEDANE